jgi:hypothetical protein
MHVLKTKTLIFKKCDIFFPPVKIAENNNHNIDPRSTAEERSKADEIDESDNSDNSEDWFLGGFTDWLQQGIAMSKESTYVRPYSEIKYTSNRFWMTRNPNSHLN